MYKLIESECDLRGQGSMLVSFNPPSVEMFDQFKSGCSELVSKSLESGYINNVSFEFFLVKMYFLSIELSGAESLLIAPDKRYNLVDVPDAGEYSDEEYAEMEAVKDEFEQAQKERSFNACFDSLLLRSWFDLENITTIDGLIVLIDGILNKLAGKWDGLRDGFGDIDFSYTRLINRQYLDGLESEFVVEPVGDSENVTERTFTRGVESESVLNNIANSLHYINNPTEKEVFSQLLEKLKACSSLDIFTFLWVVAADVPIHMFLFDSEVKFYKDNELELVLAF